MSVPFKVDLKGKTAVVTGGGGILCSCMAETLAACGAKVAILDLKLDAGTDQRGPKDAPILKWKRRLFLTPS